jgi:hypothetical protein
MPGRYAGAFPGKRGSKSLEHVSQAGWHGRSLKHSNRTMLRCSRTALGTRARRRSPGNATVADRVVRRA